MLKYPKKQTTKIIKDIDKSFIVNKKKGRKILELLNMTVGDYLLNKISSKYIINIPPDYNKLIIKQLLSDENNKKVFDFLFNHLDIFLYQKKI